MREGNTIHCPAREQTTDPAALRPDGLELTLLLLMAAVLAFELLVAPIVGLADNGDFSRIAEPLGIRPLENPPIYFSWIRTEYRFEVEKIWLRGLCCYSSETLFGIASLPVGILISSPGRFRLQAIGIVNALGFLTASALFLIALRPLRPALRPFAGLLFVVIFTDVAYVSLFNSFFTEPATLIFLVTTVALALLLAQRAGSRDGVAAAFFLSAALLVTSRPQNAILGYPFAFLALRLIDYGRERSARRRLVFAGALSLCVIALAYFWSTPRQLERIYLYNAVFLELLPDSADPRADLADLGLPADLERFVGISGFRPEAPVTDDSFRRVFEKVSYRRLARFYVSRPARVWSALDRAAEHAFDTRPLNLGNYAKETGKSPGSISQTLALWSRAKLSLAPGGLWSVLLFLLVNAIAGLTLWLRGQSRGARLAGEIWMMIVLVAGIQFAVAGLMTSSRLGTSRRSFFLFNAASDLSFGALCLLVVSPFRRPKRPTGSARWHPIWPRLLPRRFPRLERREAMEEQAAPRGRER